MEYVIDLDPMHQVLRVTLTGTVTDSSVRELRASLSHFAAAHVPYAAICRVVLVALLSGGRR